MTYSLENKTEYKDIWMCLWKVVAITVLFLFISCQNNEYIDRIKDLQSKPIDLCLDSMEYYAYSDVGLDTITEFRNRKNLSLIVYTDSSSCTTCTLKAMHKWYSFIEKLERKYYNEVKVYFIFAPSKTKMEEFRYSLDELLLKSPIFIDTSLVLIRHNDHFKSNSLTNTFLIDDDCNVIMVGSPLQNSSLEKLFYQAVEENLKRRQQKDKGNRIMSGSRR